MAVSSIRRKRVIINTIMMGALSLALYTALLLEQDIVNNLFTRGGLYALLPIGTAFLFSLVHGSFTGSFWSALGIEASQKGRRGQ
ncbi:MAG TPA: hypothetical protein VN260_09980 [Dissulfurispiraceae bacterium]|nr:hypothetical protein [Dissulfurispiraceae bacterium]